MCESEKEIKERERIAKELKEEAYTDITQECVFRPEIKRGLHSLGCYYQKNHIGHIRNLIFEISDNLPRNIRIECFPPNGFVIKKIL